MESALRLVPKSTFLSDELRHHYLYMLRHMIPKVPENDEKKGCVHVFMNSKMKASNHNNLPTLTNMNLEQFSVQRVIKPPGINVKCFPC